MTITEFIAAKTGLQVQQEFWTYLPGYSMFNTSSVECEVGEFLYALVRLVKPDRVLELGTGYGISAIYMALALKQNGRGRLTTVECQPDALSVSQDLFKKLDLAQQLEIISVHVEDYEPGDAMFDVIFIDTEPHLRFNELLRFWKNLKEGGFVLIHDLHSNMGQSGETVNDMKDWPYGTMPEALKKLIADHELQSLSPTTPRGLYLAQKASAKFYTTTLLKGVAWTAWHLPHDASHL